MAKYLEVSYYTISGVIKLIDLGEFCYGEWIVYDDCEPKYVINVHSSLQSDMIINSLINKQLETIESIINKINSKQGTRLSLGKVPTLSIIKKDELIELDLSPLPEHWLKNIN